MAAEQVSSPRRSSRFRFPFPQCLQKCGNSNREVHQLSRFSDHQTACSCSAPPQNELVFEEAVRGNPVETEDDSTGANFPGAAEVIEFITTYGPPTLTLLGLLRAAIKVEIARRQLSALDRAKVEEAVEEFGLETPQEEARTGHAVAHRRQAGSLDRQVSYHGAGRHGCEQCYRRG